MASRPAGGLRGAVSAPAGFGAAPRSKQYVSKYFHGFVITINSMILYLMISPSAGTRLVDAIS